MSVHKQAIKRYGACANLEIEAGSDTKQGQRARTAALLAMSLASEALTRIRDAEMQAERAEPTAYDLAALSVNLADASKELGETL